MSHEMLQRRNLNDEWTAQTELWFREFTMPWLGTCVLWVVEFFKCWFKLVQLLLVLELVRDWNVFTLVYATPQFLPETGKHSIGQGHTSSRGKTGDLNIFQMNNSETQWKVILLSYFIRSTLICITFQIVLIFSMFYTHKAILQT